MFISLILSFILFWLDQPASASSSSAISWQQAEDGLYYAEVAMPLKSPIGDSRIHLIRIDPAKFNFRLLCATEHGFQKKKIQDWCEPRGMLAAVNAGMFHGYNDIESYQGLTNTGYTRNYKHINNPALNSDKACICFNAKDSSMPAFQITDRSCQNFQAVMKSYNTVIQGIRLFDCNQKVVWQKDQKKWSMCLMLTDRQGFAYFAHCRSPYTVNSFCNQLKTLIPEINRGIYLEGGPESSLYLNTSAKKWALMGSYETGFWEDDSNHDLWPLANVVGIVRK
jgi:hypothetical protein